MTPIQISRKNRIVTVPMLKLEQEYLPYGAQVLRNGCAPSPVVFSPGRQGYKDSKVNLHAH
jgi:hypothetical protein